VDASRCAAAGGTDAVRVGALPSSDGATSADPRPRALVPSRRAAGKGNCTARVPFRQLPAGRGWSYNQLAYKRKKNEQQDPHTRHHSHRSR